MDLSLFLNVLTINTWDMVLMGDIKILFWYNVK